MWQKVFTRETWAIAPTSSSGHDSFQRPCKSSMSPTSSAG